MDINAPKLVALSSVLVDAVNYHNIDLDRLYRTAVMDAITCWPTHGFKWPLVILDTRTDPPAGVTVEGLALGFPFSDLVAADLRDYLRNLSQDDTPVDKIINDGVADCVGALVSEDSGTPPGELLTLLRLYDYSHGLHAHRALCAAAAVKRGVLVLLVVGRDRWDIAVCDGETKLDRSMVC